jgi:hypothetical protein
MNQNLIAVILLVIALLYLAKVITSSLRPKKHSGCCGSCCGDKKKAPSDTLVAGPGTGASH